MTEQTPPQAPLSHLSRGQKWKLLLIDEAEEVHAQVYEITKSYVYQGKPLELISATNFEVAEVLIEQNVDLSIILLGQLPEQNRTENLLQFTRVTCQNYWTRILNCTGEPKQIEDPEVIKGLQGFMGHGILSDVRLLTFLTTVLQSFEEAIYASDSTGSRLTLPESAGRGAVTVFRWQNAPNWPVEFVSLNVSGLLGYSVEELTSGVIPYSQLIFPADLERVGKEVEEYSNSQAVEFTQEYRLITRKGRVIWIFDSTKIVRNDEGDITHFFEGNYIVKIFKVINTPLDNLESI